MNTSIKRDSIFGNISKTTYSHPKEVKKEGSNLLRKYSTFIKPELLKAAKQRALDTGKKVYDIFNEALEGYLK